MISKPALLRVHLRHSRPESRGCKGLQGLWREALFGATAIIGSGERLVLLSLKAFAGCANSLPRCVPHLTFLTHLVHLTLVLRLPGFSAHCIGFRCFNS